MKTAETLGDLLYHVYDEVENLFVPDTVMLYGSYLYDRTPYDATTQYATVDDLLDKRADFIIVVDDKETAQRILGEKLQ
jgi:hypothetical protein